LIDPSTISLFKLENVESIKWAELSDQKNMKIVASNTTNLHAINFVNKLKIKLKHQTLTATLILFKKTMC